MNTKIKMVGGGGGKNSPTQDLNTLTEIREMLAREVQREGLKEEALSAFDAAIADGNSIDDAYWHAYCEWDL